MENENNTQKLRQVYETARQGMPSNAYHNFRHAEDVLGVARQLSALEGIAGEDAFVLETAALLHDYVFVIGARDNEEQSAKFAMEYLPAIGYSAEQAARVSGLVLCNKSPYKAKEPS